MPSQFLPLYAFDYCEAHILRISSILFANRSSRKEYWVIYGVGIIYLNMYVRIICGYSRWESKGVLEKVRKVILR